MSIVAQYLQAGTVIGGVVLLGKALDNNTLASGIGLLVLSCQIVFMGVMDKKRGQS